MKECYTGFTVQVNMTRTIESSGNSKDKKGLHPILPITVFTAEKSLSERIDMYIEFDETLLSYLDYKNMESFTNAIRQGARRNRLLQEHYTTQNERFYVTVHGLQKFVRNADREKTKNLTPFVESLVDVIGNYIHKLETYWIDRII
jgi:hypothetical protein